MATTLRTRISRWITLGAISALWAGCTTQLTLGDVGGLCDNDAQCKSNLSCKCVVILSTDEEGNDYIAQHGTCQQPTYVCPKDGGTDAPSGVDGGATEVGSETSDATTGDADATFADAGPSDADAATTDADAASTDATDAASADAVSTDADAASSDTATSDSATTETATGDTGADGAETASEASPDVVDPDAHD